MGLIKEPKDVDFYVDPRPLTKEGQKRISDFIKSDKKKSYISRLENGKIDIQISTLFKIFEEGLGKRLGLTVL